MTEGPPITDVELQRELDVLREQLDDAFDDVVNRINRVELRLAGVRQTAESTSTAATATGQRVADVVTELRHVAATLDAAVAAGEASADVPVPVDFRPVDGRLAELDAALTARLDAGLDAVRRQIDSLRTARLAVDTHDLEETASRGALHNAADIANLRQDIEKLAEVVRRQESGIDELRTTLNWIKDRLLLR